MSDILIVRVSEDGCAVKASGRSEIMVSAVASRQGEQPPDGTELWFTRTVDGAPVVLKSVWDGAA